MKRFVVAALSLSFLAACGPATRAQKVAALTGTATAGKTTYDQVCASCHGATGQGSSAYPTLVEPAKNDSVEEIAGYIIDGVKGTEMAAYGSVYTDQQIADLVAYVKTFK